MRGGRLGRTVGILPVGVTPNIDVIAGFVRPPAVGRFDGNSLTQEISVARYPPDRHNSP